MSARYVSVSEVIARLHTDLAFLRSLEGEDIIHFKRTSEGDLVISAEDADRVRVVLLLTGDLDINMPGVEVIMHMRDTMLAMQRQFTEILESLAEEMRRHRRG